MVRISNATASELALLAPVARHHELGNIALGIVKRNVEGDSSLSVAGIAAKIN
jgi:hypothetical protein